MEVSKSCPPLGGCSGSKLLWRWLVRGCEEPIRAGALAVILLPTRQDAASYPAVNSDEVESRRKGGINKAGDSLSAPIRTGSCLGAGCAQPPPPPPGGGRRDASEAPGAPPAARQPPARGSSGAGPLHRPAAAARTADLAPAAGRAGEGLQQLGVPRAPAEGGLEKQQPGPGWPRLGQRVGCGRRESWRSTESALVHCEVPRGLPPRCTTPAPPTPNPGAQLPPN